MDEPGPSQGSDRPPPTSRPAAANGPQQDTVKGISRPRRPSLARRLLFRVVIAVVVLGLGGCLVAVTVGVGRDRAAEGVADPDDYLVEVHSCKIDGRHPRATGLIRNNSDQVRGFRVTVTAVDGVTGSVIAARSHLAQALQPGESEDFDMPIVDSRNVASTSAPESFGCPIAVSYGRS